MLKDKRIVVTGGAGFLGRHIVRNLLEKGVPSKNIFIPRSREYDLRKKQDIEKMFKDFPADIVIHLAAYTGGIGLYNKKPATLFYGNLIMGLQLIEEARLKGAEKIVLIGSGVMYPSSAKIPLEEDSIWSGYPDSGAEAYGLYNRALLAQSQLYRKEFNLNSIFLIPANLYGPEDYFEPERAHVIPSLICKFDKAKENSLPEVEIWGTGNASREFLHADDAAKLIILATEEYNGPEPLNLGTGKDIPIRHIAEKISALIGYKGKIVWNSSKPEGQLRRCFNVARMEKELGKQKYIEIDNGLEETVHWYLMSKSK